MTTPQSNQLEPRQSSAATISFQGERAIFLHAADGADATILPGIGANCVSFRVPMTGHGIVEAIAGPESPDALRALPNSAGVPILWPHPGQHRLPLPWEGEHVTPAAFAGGRAKLAGHGFASGVPWEVIDTTASALTCRLDTRKVVGSSERWPWPAMLTATHRVEPGAVVLELEVENVADGPAPLMAGLHPYFPLRFLNTYGSDGADARETCTLWTDADQLWEVIGGAATGRVWDLNQATAGDRTTPLDLRRPHPVAEIEAHAAARGERLTLQLYGSRDALAAASHGLREQSARGTQDARHEGAQGKPSAQVGPDAPGGVTSGVVDWASGLSLTLETGREFGTVGVYCPAGRPYISLEPRTSLPDAMTLSTEQPSLTTGLRSLAPGERWRSWARFRLAPIDINSVQ